MVSRSKSRRLIKALKLKSSKELLSQQEELQPDQVEFVTTPRYENFEPSRIIAPIGEQYFYSYGKKSIDATRTVSSRGSSTSLRRSISSRFRKPSVVELDDPLVRRSIRNEKEATGLEEYLIACPSDPRYHSLDLLSGESFFPACIKNRPQLSEKPFQSRKAPKRPPTLLFLPTSSSIATRESLQQESYDLLVGTSNNQKTPVNLVVPRTHISTHYVSNNKPYYCPCKKCKDAHLSCSEIEDYSRKMMAQRLASDAEDSAEVEVLYARLDKTKLLTKKIQASMTRLETSGVSVKEAIGPILGNTQRLQVFGKNVDLVCEAIDKIQEPIGNASNERTIIRTGPQKAGLSDYLGSMKRINRSLTQLKATNLGAHRLAISELSDLLKSGSRNLEDVFRTILREDLRVVEPLHYITKGLPFPTIPQEKISRLSLINAAISSTVSQLSSNKNTLTLSAQIYAEERGPHIVSTLQNLASASISTARKKTPTDIYKRGTSGIGTYGSGLELAFLAEYDNICSVFSRDEWGRVFSLTCRSALNEFGKTLRELNAHIKANLITDAFLAYEIVEIVQSLSFRMDSKTGELKTAFADALKPVRETAKQSLPDLLDDTRRKVMAIQVLSGDGAAVPLTGEVMARLTMMPQYSAPLSTIMVSLGDGNWSASSTSTSLASPTSSKGFDVGADGKKLLANYVLDSIETLLTNLESKAPHLLKSKGAIAVFIANNVAIVDRGIKNSDLGSLLQSTNRGLDGWRKKGPHLYLDSWRECSQLLMDVQYTSRTHRPPSGNNINSAEILKGLSSKERDQIKEKFKGFNATFEELTARHRSLAMEREVKGQLARGVQEVVEPLYGRFWDRYHDVDKGKGKYVRWDKGQLASALASLR